MKFFFSKNVDSTYTKVISLLSLMSFGLLVLVGSLYYYMKVQEKEIYDSSNKVYKNEITSLLKLNTENYTSLVVDVTYWDEFVDFMTTKDVKWFNTSVANILDTLIFHINLITPQSLFENSPQALICVLRSKYLRAYKSRGAWIKKSPYQPSSSSIFEKASSCP